MEIEQPVKDKPLINLGYRPKWVFRFLILISVYVFYYFFASVTFRLPYSYFTISFGISAILLGLHFIFINRITKNMFATSYRQYGYFIIVYYIFALAGMGAHNSSVINYKDYIYSDPGIAQACGYELNDYFLTHPRPETIQDDTAFNILRRKVSEFPEGYHYVMGVWSDGIYWYTSLWLLIIFLAMYVQERIRYYLRMKKIFRAIADNRAKTIIGKIKDHGRLLIGILAVIGIKMAISVILYSRDLRSLALFFSGFLLLIFIMTIPGWLYDRLKKPAPNVVGSPDQVADRF